MFRRPGDPVVIPQDIQNKINLHLRPGLILWFKNYPAIKQPAEDVVYMGYMSSTVIEAIANQLRESGWTINYRPEYYDTCASIEIKEF